MTTDPLTILRDIGKQAGKRITATNLFDVNVCTSPYDSKRPWEILALPGDFFRHKLNIAFGKHKVTLRANGDFIAVEVAENLDLDVSSINRRDKVFQLSQSPLHVPGFPSFPVFSRQSNADLRRFLHSAALTQALGLLQLTEHESLHVNRGGIVLYLQRDSREGVMSAVEAACQLAEQFPRVDDNLDLSGLPAKFESLLGLIPKWALSDDEKRSEMLEETSLDELKSFAATVSPYITGIDEYLNSFGDEPPPEAAAALGALAECCLEAQTVIRDSEKK
jgi:hypothetical protein